MAGFKVKPAQASVRPGIAAVQGRIRAGSLRIVKNACPNLIAEAGPYRYDEAHHEKTAENPIGEYDHALDALRYLVVSLDQRRLALPTAADSPLFHGPPPPPARKSWLRLDNEALWQN